MLTPSPAPDTNDLIDEVLALVNANSSFSDFEKATLLRKAKAQRKLECRYFIMALVYAVARDYSSAKEHAYKALAHMTQPATMTHIQFVLQVSGADSEILQIIREYDYLLDNVVFAPNMARVLESLPNVEIATRVYNTLDRANKLEYKKGVASMTKHIIGSAKLAEHKFGIEPSTLGRISQFVADVAGAFDDVTLNHHSISLSPDGEYMDVTYYVELGDTLIADLNWELGDRIIDNDLDELPLVARFDVSPSTCRTVRERHGQ